MSQSSTWGETFKVSEPLAFQTGRYLTPANEPAGSTCRLIFIPDDPQFRAAVAELLTRLAFPEVWEETPGGMTAIECAALAAQMYQDFVEADCDE